MYGVDGSDVIGILIDEMIDKIVEGMAAAIPGADIILFIYKAVDFVFDVAGYVQLISKIINNIRASHDIVTILTGAAELSLLVAVPILFMVMIFNIIVRLVRRFAKA